MTTIGTNPTLADIQSAFAAENVMWRLHAQERMSERAISRQDVKTIIQGGEIIESYDTDKPFPSFLIHGKCDDQILHVVVAWDTRSQFAYVVTVYRPDRKHFEKDLKSRKSNRPHD